MTDTLFIDQPLPSVDPIWSADRDTGLDFGVSLNSVPEPPSLGLLAMGMVIFGLLALRRGPRAHTRQLDSAAKSS